MNCNGNHFRESAHSGVLTGGRFLLWMALLLVAGTAFLSSVCRNDALTERFFPVATEDDAFPSELRKDPALRAQALPCFRQILRRNPAPEFDRTSGGSSAPCAIAPFTAAAILLAAAVQNSFVRSENRRTTVFSAATPERAGPVC